MEAARGHRCNRLALVLGSGQGTKAEFSPARIAQHAIDPGYLAAEVGCSARSPPPRSFRTVAGVTPHEFGRAVRPVGQSRPARTSSATDGRATSRPSTPRSSRSAKNVAFSWSVSSIQTHTAKPSALARATTSGVRTSTPS